MTDHEFYEVLCTLAATGQLPASEKIHFYEHCVHCTECRDQLCDLISVGAQLHLNAYLDSTPASMPAGAAERFRARAIREGIALRPAPARPSASYALASAAMVLVVIGLLTLSPRGRRVPQRFQTSAAAILPAQQSLPAPIPRQAVLTRTAKPARAYVARRAHVPQTATESSDDPVIAQRFPQAINASYSFLGSQIPEPAVTDYPALSRSQLSLLTPFRSHDGSNDRNLDAIATYDHPTNIASTGNAYDFAANIRELHFQLPTAQ